VRRRSSFRSTALAGRGRIGYFLGKDPDAFGPYIEAAQELALKHEYNDVLAALYLLRGNAACYASQPNGKGLAAAQVPDHERTLRCYLTAMVYALRYNRFLLDGVLSGKVPYLSGTAIVPMCLADPKGGAEILKSLKSLWSSGQNTLQGDVPESISPIAGDMPLAKAEEMARVREVGDMRPQKSVLRQIDVAIDGTAATRP
jgi:hypothetical protein